MTQINTFLIFFLSCQMCLMNLKMNLKKHILLVIFITSVLLLFFSFKQGTGDPEGFKLFLSELGVPIGSFPRYVGNRLHVLFHIACFIVRHLESLRVFLKGNNYQGHFSSSQSEYFTDCQCIILITSERQFIYQKNITHLQINAAG